MSVHPQTPLFIKHVSMFLLFLICPIILAWRARRGFLGPQSYFNVRVESGFADSEIGRSILRNFRWRLLLWSFLTCAVYAGFLKLGLEHGSALIAGLLLVIGNHSSFSKASRKVQTQSFPQKEPSERTADLFTQEEEKSVGLAFGEWFGILTPILVAAGMIGVSTVNRSGPPATAGIHHLIATIALAGMLGSFASFNQFALRFRARSRDWNPNPLASRRYRTMLGLLLSVPATFLLIVFSFVLVIPTDRAAMLIEPFVLFLLMGAPLVVAFVLGIRWWLKRNSSAERGDPMPDTSWRFGSFYINRNDPALVVPMRWGRSYSFNFAHPIVWCFFIVPAVLSVVLAFGGSF